jgi:hypothetical protein
LGEERQASKSEIIQDFAAQKNSLEQQIDLLNQRILSLQNHILTLEQTNRTLEQLARSEKDAQQKARLFGAIRVNIELLAKLYSVVKEFEDVRFRYYKEVDDVLYNKFRLIAVEIRRIEEKVGETSSGDILRFFENLSTILSNPEKRSQMKVDLEENPEYKL